MSYLTFKNFFLAHFAFGQVSFCYHLASVIHRKLSHFKLILLNHWSKYGKVRNNRFKATRPGELIFVSCIDNLIGESSVLGNINFFISSFRQEESIVILCIVDNYNLHFNCINYNRNLYKSNPEYIGILCNLNLFSTKYMISL